MNSPGAILKPFRRMAPAQKRLRNHGHAAIIEVDNPADTKTSNSVCLGARRADRPRAPPDRSAPPALHLRCIDNGPRARRSRFASAIAQVRLLVDGCPRVCSGSRPFHPTSPTLLWTRDKDTAPAEFHRPIADADRSLRRLRGSLIAPSEKQKCKAVSARAENSSAHARHKMPLCQQALAPARTVSHRRLRHRDWRESI